MKIEINIHLPLSINRNYRISLDNMIFDFNRCKHCYLNIFVDELLYYVECKHNDTLKFSEDNTECSCINGIEI